MTFAARVNRPASAPAWLVAQPIAHRGLHDAARGLIENSISAAAAAIAAGFAIECDVQLTADGEVVVFHDFTLDRLTKGAGRVDSLPARALAALELGATSDRISMLEDLLAAIGGRVPLVCEIKSRFDGDMRLADRVKAIAATYAGPLALKSFDPAVIAHLRATGVVGGAGALPLGIVAEAEYDDPAWEALSSGEKFALANLLHYCETKPDFLSYAVNDLPRAVPFLCRHGIGLPIMTWTVRTQNQRRVAKEHADQMIFEGFLP